MQGMRLLLLSPSYYGSIIPPHVMRYPYRREMRAVACRKKNITKVDRYRHPLLVRVIDPAGTAMLICSGAARGPGQSAHSAPCCSQVEAGSAFTKCFR